MSTGLDRILERIVSDPEDKILRNRFITLVSELPDESEKITYIIKLAEVFLYILPREAMRFANMVFKADPENIEALEIIAHGLDAIDRESKAEVIRQQIAHIKSQNQLKTTAVQDDGLAITTIDVSNQRVSPGVQSSSDTFVTGADIQLPKQRGPGDTIHSGIAPGTLSDQHFALSDVATEVSSAEQLEKASQNHQSLPPLPDPTGDFAPPDKAADQVDMHIDANQEIKQIDMLPDASFDLVGATSLEHLYHAPAVDKEIPQVEGAQAAEVSINLEGEPPKPPVAKKKKKRKKKKKKASSAKAKPNPQLNLQEHEAQQDLVPQQDQGDNAQDHFNLSEAVAGDLNQKLTFTPDPTLVKAQIPRRGGDTVRPEDLGKSKNSSQMSAFKASYESKDAFTRKLEAEELSSLTGKSTNETILDLNPAQKVAEVDINFNKQAITEPVEEKKNNGDSRKVVPKSIDQSKAQTTPPDKEGQATYNLQDQLLAMIDNEIEAKSDQQKEPPPTNNFVAKTYPTRIAKVNLEDIESDQSSQSKGSRLADLAKKVDKPADAREHSMASAIADPGRFGSLASQKITDEEKEGGKGVFLATEKVLGRKQKTNLRKVMKGGQEEKGRKNFIKPMSKDNFYRIIYSALAKLSQGFKPQDKAQVFSNVENTEIDQDILELLKAKLFEKHDLRFVWSLVQSLWGERPCMQSAQFLESIGLQRSDTGYWGFYLDSLINAGYSRKALHEIKSTCKEKKDLEWARVAYRRLPSIWQALKVQGFRWSEADGVDALSQQLSVRPKITLSGTWLSG